MDAFSNPADFLLDITNGEAVSALVTPSPGTNNIMGSQALSECKSKDMMVQMIPVLLTIISTHEVQAHHAEYLLEKKGIKLFLNMLSRLFQ